MTIVTEPGFKTGDFQIYEIEGIDIAQWSHDREGLDPPTQVHLSIKVRGLAIPLVARFKSPKTLGIVIEQLARYRKEVWPHS